MNRVSAFFIVLVGCVFASSAGAQTEPPNQRWAFETGAGYNFVPGGLLDKFQNRYKASISGISSGARVVWNHKDGTPNVAFGFYYLKLDGTATDARGNGTTFKGNADLFGGGVRKYATFHHGVRVSPGLILGAGVGPQFKANYTQTYSDGRVAQKTYMLKESPVTPYEEFLARMDIRVSRHVYLMPYGGWQGVGIGAGAALRFQ